MCWSIQNQSTPLIFGWNFVVNFRDISIYLLELNNNFKYFIHVDTALKGGGEKYIFFLKQVMHQQQSTENIDKI